MLLQSLSTIIDSSRDTKGPGRRAAPPTCNHAQILEANTVRLAMAGYMELCALNTVELALAGITYDISAFWALSWRDVTLCKKSRNIQVFKLQLNFEGFKKSTSDDHSEFRVHMWAECQPLYACSSPEQWSTKSTSTVQDSKARIPGGYVLCS